MRRPFYEFFTSTTKSAAGGRGAGDASANSTPSRPRYAATPPNTAGRSVRTEVGRSWMPCTLGCTTMTGRVSAASDLAKAIRYAIRHWPGSGGLPR